MKNPIPLYKSERTLCCVFGCNSRISFKFYNGIRFHKLPFDPSKTLLKKWVNAIKLPRRICSHMIICSRHFKDSDYTVIDGIKELDADAIPSQHLPKIWRNKFLPRDYGRLIKVIEVRGIGRLRLCFEAKLARAIKKAGKKRKEKIYRRNEEEMKAERSTNNPQASQDDAVKTTSGSTTQDKSDKKSEQIATPHEKDNEIPNTFNTDRTGISHEKEKEITNIFNNFKESNQQTEEHSLTSEIVIKDEPLSEPEETEESVEEMLAKMNEESLDDLHITHIENDNRSFDFESENPDFITSLDCNICGDEDCEGHLEEPYFCAPCGKYFKTSRQLNAHNLSHFEYRRRGYLADKEPVCKVCNKALSSKTSLNEHMLTHSNFRQYVCMLCDKIFRNKANLVMHINSHTIHSNHRCKMCGQCFEDADELDQHVRKHKVLTREYTCRECGQRFKSKQSCWAHLNSHMRAKSKPGLSCDVCGRVLSTKATLREHMFIHSGEKPFECQLCGKKIRHRANFIIHVQGHSLGQPHMCSFCGMGFSKKNELCSHIAAEHPEDRPFFCIICGMRFRTEKRFHKHAMSHDASLEDEI